MHRRRPSSVAAGSFSCRVRCALVWGLRFDVLIRLKEEAETTVVDVRVASRYGPHDLGMGADIAETFLDALDAEMQGLNDS